jgi:predicted PurR-regulated permease PerM
MSREDTRSHAASLGIWIIAVIATLWFLRTAAALLIPLVLGLVISYALEPVVAWLERRHVPRMAGASMVMLILLASVGWGLYSLRDNAVSALEALPEAARRTRELVIDQLGAGQAQVEKAAAELRGDGEGDGSATAAEPTPGAGDGAAAAMPLGPTNGIAQQLAQSSMAFAAHATVVVFLVFFLLLSGHRFRSKAVEAAGADPERRRIVAGIMRDVDAQVQRFLLVRIVASTVVAIATWPTLAWLGMPNALVWAVLAGLFSTIPYFGAAIVSVGLFVVALVQIGDATAAIGVSMAALVITSLEGWLLTPALLGKVQRMSVLTVFVGLLVWTWLWGGWGTLLAVPMLSVLKSAADRIESLKPVGKLMSP